MFPLHIVPIITNDRKKCDEKYPVCTSCKLKNRKCEWPPERAALEKKVRKQKEIFPHLDADPDLSEPFKSVLTDLSHSTALISTLVSTPDFPPLDHLSDIHPNGYDSGYLSATSADEFLIPDIPSPKLSSAILPSLEGLDDIGITYLQHYRDIYCSTICIGQSSLNYFVKTFLQLAHSRESILFALTAFGGFWYELSQPEKNLRLPWMYMQKAAKKICDEVGEGLRPSNKEDFFVLFSFYLIFIGIEVCTGDVCHWSGFLRRCALLINDFGGLQKVCLMFSSTNDIKWLLSDFQAHDLLSSRALMMGSLIPTEEYEHVLPEDMNYGLDPLQGVLSKVYNLFGEMGRARGELQKKSDRIDEILEGAPAEPGEDVEELRMNYYDEASQKYNMFKARIDELAPSKLHLEMLRRDPEDKELQVHLFNLYVIICRIQLGTSIMRMPPTMVEQQRSLIRALKIIDEKLLHTRFRVSLSLLILVCGLLCYRDYDRIKMRQRLAGFQADYYVGNVNRIEETIEEAWIDNPDGTQVMDWAELAQRKGWNLYVG